ncbi:MAG: hypothetical protein VR72_12775 [Clostridiaceae bacterium BRH_c20a]|nr:MAG: hypothetical protein VR72_12775 [Clostridiaceae bacterium BRH_c20a]
MWKELLLNLSKGNKYVKLNPPATKHEILEIEKELGLMLSSDLKELLLEFNGDNFFIFSTAQILEINSMMREFTCFMPLNCLLFVAGNGCGDYYGYAITGDGIKDWEIYMWEHEYDNRIYKANGLKDVIEKYYTEHIK